jgi:hypothetical protein
MTAVSSIRTRLLSHSETFDIASDILKTRIINIHPPRILYTQHRQHNNRNTTGIELKSCSPHVANVCRAFQVCRRQHIEEKGELFRLLHLNMTKHNTVHIFITHTHLYGGLLLQANVLTHLQSGLPNRGSDIFFCEQKEWFCFKEGFQKSTSRDVLYYRD